MEGVDHARHSVQFRTNPQGMKILYCITCSARIGYRGIAKLVRCPSCATSMDPHVKLSTFCFQCKMYLSHSTAAYFVQCPQCKVIMNPRTNQVISLTSRQETRIQQQEHQQMMRERFFQQQQQQQQQQHGMARQDYGYPQSTLENEAISSQYGGWAPPPHRMGESHPPMYSQQSHPPPMGYNGTYRRAQIQGGGRGFFGQRMPSNLIHSGEGFSDFLPPNGGGGGGGSAPSGGGGGGGAIASGSAGAGGTHSSSVMMTQTSPGSMDGRAPSKSAVMPSSGQEEGLIEGKSMYPGGQRQLMSSKGWKQTPNLYTSRPYMDASMHMGMPPAIANKMNTGEPAAFQPPPNLRRGLQQQQQQQQTPSQPHEYEYKSYSSNQGIVPAHSRTIDEKNQRTRPGQKRVLSENSGEDAATPQQSHKRARTEPSDDNSASVGVDHSEAKTTKNGKHESGNKDVAAGSLSNKAAPLSDSEEGSKNRGAPPNIDEEAPKKEGLSPPAKAQTSDREAELSGRSQEVRDPPPNSQEKDLGALPTENPPTEHKDDSKNKEVGDSAQSNSPDGTKSEEA